MCCTFKLLEFYMQSKRLYVFVCFALKQSGKEGDDGGDSLSNFHFLLSLEGL